MNKNQFSCILDCIIYMIKIIVKHYPDKLNEFLVLIKGNSNEKDLVYNITLQFKVCFYE